MRGSSCYVLLLRNYGADSYVFLSSDDDVNF
jgi:hypothetical protein